jgi:hypothetical protein
LVVLEEKTAGGLPGAIIEFKLKVKAMGDFPAHGLFYFCLFFGRLNSKRLWILTIAFFVLGCWKTPLPTGGQAFPTFRGK